MVLENELYHGDCIDFMRDMPDKSIDCVICDPPYGIDENSHRQQSRTKLAQTTNYGSFYWDKERVGKEYFDHILRISKNAVIFGGNYYTDILPQNDFWIIWDKRVEDRYTCNFADCEMIWTNFPGQSRMIRFLWNGMIQHDMKNKEKRVHPTQKPQHVMKKIIEMVTKPNDLILDPFMGGGKYHVSLRRYGTSVHRDR